jgi:hypothetical protein
VARRGMEMPAAKKSRKEPDEAVSTSTVLETGRYLLQVDKQTKAREPFGSLQLASPYVFCSERGRFFPTPEAAPSAGLKIKKSFPHLQVAIYDSVTNSRTLVTLPIASK